MKKDLTCALLLSACCNLALAATSPLATTNDYYYIQPKTTNILGRVMGENGDYRLVRAEDIAFINEAWAERGALGREWWYLEETVPGGPLVKRGWQGSLYRYWAEATLGNSVLETGSMADRLAEASGGAMTNIVIKGGFTDRLVNVAMVTNEFAQLKKAKVLAVVASVAYTNEEAEVRQEMWNSDWVEGYGTEESREIQTNRVDGGSWYIQGSGYNRGVGEEFIWDGDDWSVWRKIKRTRKDAMSGSVKMRLGFDVYNTNDWLRGETSPKVVESVHAWAVVEVDWQTQEEWWEWNVGEDTAISSNIVKGIEATNVNVIVDMGAAEWVGTSGRSLVWEVGREMKDITEAATGVANAPDEEEIAAEAVVPELGEDGGMHERVKSKNISIKDVYLVIRVKPVTSLPGW